MTLIPVPVGVVTLIGPLLAPPGTAVVIWISLSTVKLLDVPLNFTSVVPVRAVPLMTTFALVRPAVGVKLLTTGTAPTVKLFTLVPVPAAVVTETSPVVAPEGTCAVMVLSLQPVMLVAGVPLNFN